MMVEDTVLTNMYYNKVVEHENMGYMRVSDYIIEFIREEIDKSFFQIQYEYRCIIVIKDLLNRELRRIVINEAQAMQLIDGINAYVYDNMSEEVYLLTNISGPTIYEEYTICLAYLDGEYQNARVQMIVNRYNSALETLEPVLTIPFTLDELDKFVDTAFFIFLIDLASAREGIFKV